MNSDLTGRTVIVTGGATGIGRSYSEAFSALGANVVIADINVDAGTELAATLDAADGGGALFVATDVASLDDTQRLAEQTLARFGTIDALVNNAALYQDMGVKRPFDEITVEEWDRIMNINTRGVWLCMKAVAPAMREQGSGKIVNIASGVVHAGVPWFSHYVASKAAVLGLTRSVARELGPDGINVNGVAPGLVANESSERLNGREYLDGALGMRSIKRDMLPEDLVGTVVFLCSPQSDFVTGQTIIVDGGVTVQ